MYLYIYVLVYFFPSHLFMLLKWVCSGLSNLFTYSTKTILSNHWRTEQLLRHPKCFLNSSRLSYLISSGVTRPDSVVALLLLRLALSADSVSLRDFDPNDSLKTMDPPISEEILRKTKMIWLKRNVWVFFVFVLYNYDTSKVKYKLCLVLDLTVLQSGLRDGRSMVIEFMDFFCSPMFILCIVQNKVVCKMLSLFYFG